MQSGVDAVISSETYAPARATSLPPSLPRFPIFDDRSDPILDHITALTAQVCNTPVAVINLISQEQQQFKSVVGLPNHFTPSGHHFCRQALQTDEILIVHNALREQVFAHEPLVEQSEPYLFYAGKRLCNPDGVIFGTLFVLDHRPRSLNPAQQLALSRLSHLAAAHLDLQFITRRQRDQERLNQLIINNALDYAIITTNIDGVITSWSSGAQKLFGWNEREICNRSIDVLFTPEDRDQGIPETRRVSALHHQQDPVERWHMRKDGSRFWASGQLLMLYDDHGQVQGFLKILNDRTFNRNQQKQLREKEEMLRLSQESGGIAAFEVELPSLQMTATEHIRQIYGLSAQEPITPQLFEAQLHPEDLKKGAGMTKAICAAQSHDAVALLPAHHEYRIFRRDTGEERWIARSTEIVNDDQGQVVRIRGVVQDITIRKRAEELQNILTAELAHRSKNILAVIQGIANQTLRTTTTAEEARLAFSARIQALAKAQDVLTQGIGRSGACLSDLVEKSLTIHLGHDLSRLHVRGLPVMLNAKQALSMVMALHELGTNAVKYGALSNSKGRIAVHWGFHAGRFHFNWTESGGPAVAEPTKRGFGSRLIERTLAASLGGTAKLQFLPAGLTFDLDAPETALHETTSGAFSQLDAHTSLPSAKPQR